MANFQPSVVAVAESQNRKYRPIKKFAKDLRQGLHKLPLNRKQSLKNDGTEQTFGVLFLTLPAELRLLIYDHLKTYPLPTPSPRMVRSWQDLQKGTDLSFPNIHNGFDFSFPTSALLINRQVYEEMLAILYPENTFTICDGLQHKYKGLSLRKLTKHPHRNLVTNFRICMRVREAYWHPSTPFSIVAGEKAMKEPLSLIKQGPFTSLKLSVWIQESILTTADASVQFRELYSSYYFLYGQIPSKGLNLIAWESEADKPHDERFLQWFQTDCRDFKALNPLILDPSVISVLMTSSHFFKYLELTIPIIQRLPEMERIAGGRKGLLSRIRTHPRRKMSADVLYRTPF